MRLDTINEAIAEAERFLKKAKAARKQAQEEKPGFYANTATGPVASATKRASMDLTRALVPLRRDRT